MRGIWLLQVGLQETQVFSSESQYCSSGQGSMAAPRRGPCGAERREREGSWRPEPRRPPTLYVEGEQTKLASSPAMLGGQPAPATLSLSFPAGTRWFGGPYRDSSPCSALFSALVDPRLHGVLACAGPSAYHALPAPRLLTSS